MHRLTSKQWDLHLGQGVQELGLKQSSVTLYSLLANKAQYHSPYRLTSTHEPYWNYIGKQTNKQKTIPSRTMKQKRKKKKGSVTFSFGNWKLASESWNKVTFWSQLLEDFGNTVPVVRWYAGPRDVSRASDVSQRENTGHGIPAKPCCNFPSRNLYSTRLKQ